MVKVHNGHFGQAAVGPYTKVQPVLIVRYFCVRVKLRAFPTNRISSRVLLYLLTGFIHSSRVQNCHSSIGPYVGFCTWYMVTE